jgi:hypothetical protein
MTKSCGTIAFVSGGEVGDATLCIADSLSAQIKYDEQNMNIAIQQTTSKFDDYTSSPAPLISYEKKLKNGIVWMQEIPLLQGSGCWLSCVDAPRPLDLIQLYEYQPIAVAANSNISINYPAAIKPSSISINMLTDKKMEEMNFKDGKLTLPSVPGIYNILVKSVWDGVASTGYVFAVEVKA